MTRRRSKLAFIGRRMDRGASGARIAHYELGRALAARGHDVRFAAERGGARTILGDPVHVGHVAQMVRWADVVFVRDEQRIRKLLGRVPTPRRLIYVAHAPSGAPCERRLDIPEYATVVWSSEAARADATRLFGPQPGIVIEGYPVDLSRYRTSTGDHVTLVNLSRRKGGPLFWELATRLPGVPFLGVRGWGKQVIPRRTPFNVRVVESQPDPRSVYSETRILLVPSADVGTVAEAETHLPNWAECWNRVSVEAASSGIPVIAHPAAGVRSSIGQGALYADRNDVDAWVALIERLHADPEFYAERRRAALGRVVEIEATRASILDQFEALL